MATILGASAASVSIGIQYAPEYVAGGYLASHAEVA